MGVEGERSKRKEQDTTTAEDRGEILKEIKLRTTQATVQHQFTLDI